MSKALCDVRVSTFDAWILTIGVVAVIMLWPRRGVDCPSTTTSSYIGEACRRVSRWQLGIFNTATLFVTVLNNANITVQEFFQQPF